jgi:hypothetical protein
VCYIYAILGDKASAITTKAGQVLGLDVALQREVEWTRALGAPSEPIEVIIFQIVLDDS